MRRANKRKRDHRWDDVHHDGRTFHVVPVRDLERHIDAGCNCWCEPAVERLDNGNYLVTHNSADGRELIERHGLQ